MKEMDCVEVIVEKECYAKHGVHKGMQGWICLDDHSDGYWLVNFPQYGEKDDGHAENVRYNFGLDQWLIWKPFAV